MHYPEHLLKLISILKKLPGVGAKTAERFAFHLLDWPDEKLEEMGTIVADVKKKIVSCGVCGALIDGGECSLCTRESTHLCVVASPKDIFSFEETRTYHGLYHVIGALLSPLMGEAPAPHRVELLKERIVEGGVEEVILALDSTLEGDATALYLKKELSPLPVTTTRLALGLPMGSALDYIDGGTLARALSGRSTY